MIDLIQAEKRFTCQRRRGGQAHRAWAGLIACLLLGIGSCPALGSDVAVIISAKADAYLEALEGFKQVVSRSGHRIVKVYDMRGDFNSGRDFLEEINTQVKPDLVLVIGVWALELIAQHKPSCPVVYAMVLNPYSIIGPEAAHFTGASMNTPVEQTLRFLGQVSPNIRRVGTVFNQDRTGPLVDEAYRIAKDLGFELVAKRVQSARGAISAINELQDEQVDALWLLPDKTVLDPKVVRQMLLVSYRAKIPLVGLSERQAKMGTLLAVSFASGKDIGRQAGELTNRLLGGTPVSSIPYTTARRINLFVNVIAAKKLSIDIPHKSKWAQAVSASADPGVVVKVTMIK